MAELKTTKRKHKWTEKEDKILKELYSSPMSIDEIAERLGRTKSGIIHRVYIIGARRDESKLQRHKRYFGCDEDCFHCPYPDCLKQFGFAESY